MLRLRELRKLKGLSQKEIAQSLGVTQSLISAYEKGERVPPIKKLLRLADILGVTIEELLEKTYQEGHR